MQPKLGRGLGIAIGDFMKGMNPNWKYATSAVFAPAILRGSREDYTAELRNKFGEPDKDDIPKKQLKALDKIALGVGGLADGIGGLNGLKVEVAA